MVKGMTDGDRDLALGVGSDKRRTPTPSKADWNGQHPPDELRTSDI
jgi:hypothetical protein